MAGKLSGWVLAAACVLGAAACGTTVPAGATTALDAGLGGPATQGTSSLEPIAGGASAGPATAAAGGTSSSQTQGATRTGAGASKVSVGPSTTKPATLSPVEVGFEYATGVTAFASALGISADVGDGQAQARAIVTWVNSHGGLGGHPIRPVFYALDLTRTDPYSQFMQEMCAKWTVDHHVVAAFAYANADYTPLAGCLSKKGAVFSAYASYARDRADYRTSPGWVEPATLTAERLAPLQVQTFERLGFLKGQKRVGLLAYDYDQAQQLTSLLVAELKRRGITTSVYPIHYGGSTPELGATITSIQNAVLRFRSEGIERVMSAAYPGAIAFFMRYADSQRYRPLYGLSSYDALAALPANAPASQLSGAVAAGWWPTADLSSSDPRPLNASGQICRAAFRKAAIPPSQDTYSFGYCDFTLSLQAASRSLSSATLSGSVLRDGLLSLGSGYASPSMLGTALSPSQHDGVAAARPLGFVDSCTCWRAKGPVSPVR